MIIAVYAALLSLILILLSVRTLLLRKSLKIGIGDGGNSAMIRAMRVHSNFCEYVPIALILALIIELSGGHWALINFVCLVLLVGRCIHAWGVSREKENYNFRVLGMALTFTSISTSALILLFLSVASI